MTATRDEKLKQLRRVVEAAPDERLAMHRFYSHQSCGTALCAAGHARIDDWFRENTTIGEIFGVSTTSRKRWAEIAGDGQSPIRYGRGVVADVYPKHWGESFRRLAELFEIDEDDAYRLFGGNLSFFDRDTTKEQVIANIDRLLAGERATLYPTTHGEE